MREHEGAPRRSRAAAAGRRRPPRAAIASSTSPGSSWSRRVRPHAGVAVGLQLEPDGERVRLRRVLALEAADLVAGAAQVLDVVADLVRDHVRPREVPGAPSWRSMSP